MLWTLLSCGICHKNRIRPYPWYKISKNWIHSYPQNLACYGFWLIFQANTIIFCWVQSASEKRSPLRPVWIVCIKKSHEKVCKMSTQNLKGPFPNWIFKQLQYVKNLVKLLMYFLKYGFILFKTFFGKNLNEQGMAQNLNIDFRSI